jgi:hypothetical protein
MIFFDYNRDTQRRRIFMTDNRNAGQPKLIADLNINDRYNDIGQPVMKTLPNGANVIRPERRRNILFGRRIDSGRRPPFLRRMNLSTLKTEEIFRSGIEEYETFCRDDRRQRNEISYAKRNPSPHRPTSYTEGLPCRTNVHGDGGQADNRFQRSVTTASRHYETTSQIQTRRRGRSLVHATTCRRATKRERGFRPLSGRILKALPTHLWPARYQAPPIALRRSAASRTYSCS